jgi:hypothetical protein
MVLRFQNVINTDFYGAAHSEFKLVLILITAQEG